MAKNYLYPIIIFFIIFIFSQRIFSQETIIHGKICHANTFQGIANVNVYIEEINVGSVSDERGEFYLRFTHPKKDYFIIFEHVGFDTLRVSHAVAKMQEMFYLTPRLIQSSDIIVEAEKDRPEILKDLPQPLSIVDAKNFSASGYMDAGDLLRTEQSIQIEEDLSGEKSISIRGGNADDVIILYNGIKMNNSYNNTFNLSLINLENIKQIEIIKGSNSVLYGSEAFSGVVNIVPKTHQDFTIRFLQKIGTYASGTWDLQLNYNFLKKLNLSYNIEQSGMKREYSDSSRANDYLENKSTFHSANLVYDLSDDANDSKNNLSILYIRSNLDYQNSYYTETLSDFNQMISGRYSGNIWKVDKLNLVSSYQWLKNEQKSSSAMSYIDRHLLNKAFNFNIEKTFLIEQVELLLAYQYTFSNLDFKDEISIQNQLSAGVESALLERKKHGIVSILKLHIPTNSEFYKNTDLDISYRYDAINNYFSDVIDRISNQQNSANSTIRLTDSQWNESMLKFSSHVSGSDGHFNTNAYLNFGTNFKFPTMFQQISLPLSSYPDTSQSMLYPEKNTSIEIGFEFFKETINDPSINGWRLGVNYFRNVYDNKLRVYYLPTSPIAYYDNVQETEISGFEFKGNLFLLQNKLNLELGASLYSIPEKAAFPFKSDKKYILNLELDHKGYSFRFHWFKESEQLGWLRNMNGAFSEVPLPGYANIDLHITKNIELYGIKLLFNFSGRNLLNDDTKIEGLALRDRRIYLTFGGQY